MNNILIPLPPTLSDAVPWTETIPAGTVKFADGFVIFTDGGVISDPAKVAANASDESGPFILAVSTAAASGICESNLTSI